MNDTVAVDPAETLRRWSSVAGRAQQMMLEYWSKQAAAPALHDYASMVDQWAATAKAIFAHPDRLAAMQAEYLARSIDLWKGFATGEGGALAAAANKDKRFRGETWRTLPGFDLVRQMYLLTSEFVIGTARNADGLSPDQRQAMLFNTRQFVDAMSPSNFMALNPEALKAFTDTGGESLLSGLEHMLGDLAAGKLTMVDEGAFEVGRNIATTPGKVVFENALFQLVQYAPTTSHVREIPVLIMPPWINKFYILDLTPEKSFIRWAVGQGLTVFVVSWRNPGRDFAGATIETYVAGYVDAIDAVLARTGASATHMIGYCVAGTTLAVALGWMAMRGGVEKVRSATFFTAQVDFADPGELKIFVDEPHLKQIEELTRETGYLDGRYMATTFNLLRSNDLVWNYVVNNYLMGKEYLAFDLLYWNSDATNVPAKWHASYLRDYYRDNKLVQPGGIVVDGTPIDLTRIPTPAYVQAGREDHIAPARSVYRMRDHWTAPLRFVLAGSGHIAGVVNPPSAHKYGYWTGTTLPATLQEFEASATEHKGSWWPDWLAWLTPMSGEEVAARHPGPGIEDAPGRYVREKI